MAAAAGGRCRAAASRLSTYRLRRRIWLIGPLVLYAVLRIPSFLEPHWYTDEAGYATTARALLQGKVLYSQKTGEFENMRNMNPEAVTAFLNRWKA